MNKERWKLKERRHMFGADCYIWECVNRPDLLGKPPTCWIGVNSFWQRKSQSDPAR